MGNQGFQDFWITGSRVYFQRDPVLIAGAYVPQPILDFGRIDPVSPSVKPTIAKLMDSDGGIKRLVAQEVTQIDETYAVKCSNMNMDMQAILFMANPPTSFAQAVTPIVSTQWAVPGRMVKLLDTTGKLVYGIASITSITSASTPLVAGTDYDVVSLERGLIKVYATSLVLTVAGNIVITYVPRLISAQTSGGRIINPQQVGTVNGTGLIVFSRSNNLQQSVREARFSITPNASTFSDTQFSDHTVDMAVLNDLTQPVPAGRLLYWLGDLPPTV